MKSLPLLIMMIITTPLMANGFDLSDVIKPFTTTLCTAMSAPAIPKCVQRFTQELKDSRNQVLKSYETRGYCCAFNDLKDCIVEHVGDKCGHTKTIRQLVAPFVETLKDISTPSGDCDDFDGFRGTVLCQPDWLLIVEAIGVVILLLMSVSAVIRCCCCGSRGGVRPYPMQSFVNPIAGNNYRPVPSGGPKYP